MNINRLLKLVLRGGVILNNAFSIAICLALSFFLCTSLGSCAGGAGGGGSDGAEETALSVTFPQTMATYTATDLASYSVTIESSKYTATKSGSAGGTITFTNIPVGTYKVTAYGKKADGSIAAKNNPNETSVTIEEGKTKTTVIRLHLLDYFTVTFKSSFDDSVIGTPQQVTSGEKATRPANPVSPIPDSSFVNWYSDNDCTTIFNFNTAINADIEVYAKFSDVYYTVTFNYNGGKDASNNTSSSDTYSYNDPVDNVPASETITKTGFKCIGWGTSADTSIEDAITSIPDATGDATYYAVWTPVYTITYQGVTSYGILNATSPNSYTYGTPVTIPDAGNGSGTFAGWYTDAALTTAFTGITATTTGNITLYAKFTATVRIYKEKVSGTLTTLLDTQTVTCGKTATALATAPTKTGYEWDEWKYGTGAGSTFTFGSTSGTAITGDCDVWATWTQKPTSFTGSVSDFLTADFSNTSTQASPYSITITGVSSSTDLSSIVTKLCSFTAADDSEILWCSLTLQGTIGEIPDQALMCNSSTKQNYGLTKVTSIVLPNSVTKIGDWGLSGMENVTSITLPSSLEEIGKCALQDIGKATTDDISISLPASCCKISGMALSGSNINTISGSAVSFTDWKKNGSALNRGLTANDLKDTVYSTFERGD